MIPPFETSGNLPAGQHPADWDEVVQRFGTTARRRMLLAGLREALEALRAAGCQTVYLNGSFVTAKPEPQDYDGCWDMTGVDPALLNPVLLDFSQGRAAQKARYLGELFPAQVPEGLSGRIFLEFFQIDRTTGHAKGIVVLELRSLP